MWTTVNHTKRCSGAREVFLKIHPHNFTPERVDGFDMFIFPMQIEEPSASDCYYKVVEGS